MYRELREVEVRPDPVYQRGETLTYVSSEIEQHEEEVLEKLIARIPGIDIDEQGKISHEGKAINKFYIEDMDLLEGRYGIATEHPST